MIDPPTPADLTQPTRHRGRIGQWSDRVKALALLVLLAVAGGVLGLPAGNNGDAGTAREGVASEGSGLRASLPDLQVAALAGEPEDRHPDHGDGGDPPPRALAPAAILPLAPATSSLALPIIQTVSSRPRAGHDTRMPTGPPARLSI